MKTVKAINTNEQGQWLLDVLGVPFGGPYGGKDAHGEYFTPKTDLWLERIPKRPVVYYHGLAEQGAAEVIGEELGWEKRADGIWFRVLLDATKQMARRVWDAAQRGAARASSGAISHLVRVESDGRIVMWPIGEISLLDARQHTPANPYAVARPYSVGLIRAKATFKAAGLRGIEAFDGIPDWGGVPYPPARQKVAAQQRSAEQQRTVPRGVINLLRWSVSPESSSDRATVQHEKDQDMNKEKYRDNVQQAFISALEQIDDADGYQSAHMVASRQAPAVIQERGEPLLTANGTPFVDAVKALRRGRFEVVRFQLAGKALSEGTDSAGGYLVPVEAGKQLIEMLRAKTAVRAAGATVIPMLGDTLQIPSQSGGATAYWVAENAQITASDQAFGQVQLQAKKLAAMTKLSSELFEDSDPQVEALVMADLARVLALEEDIKYLRGTGTSNTPLGLENIAGVNVDSATLGANGGTPTFDQLANMLYNLDADNVPSDGRAWIVHPRTINTLRKVKDSSSKYLWADPAAPGDPPTLWGYPVFSTTAIPINLTQGTSNDTSVIYLGAWSEFVIGQRKQLELRTSDAAGNAFEFDQVFIRAIMRVDCNVRHAASFEVLKGVRA